MGLKSRKNNPIHNFLFKKNSHSITDAVLTVPSLHQITLEVALGRGGSAARPRLLHSGLSLELLNPNALVKTLGQKEAHRWPGWKGRSCRD
jgi:hypothetical protein